MNLQTFNMCSEQWAGIIVELETITRSGITNITNATLITDIDK